MALLVKVRDLSQEVRPQSYCEGVVIRRRMRHSDVLSIEGVAPELFDLRVVSELMPQGTMTHHLRKNESVDLG